MASLLVVDDDPVSRLVAEHILVGAGHTVVSCASAREARGYLDIASEPVDVVVCDIQMPDESGLDLLQSVHTSSVDAPPFLLLTGIGDQEQLDDERTLGAAGFLTKPVRSEELLDHINAILQAQTSHKPTLGRGASDEAAGPVHL